MNLQLTSMKSFVESINFLERLQPAYCGQGLKFEVSSLLGFKF